MGGGTRRARSPSLPSLRARHSTGRVRVVDHGAGCFIPPARSLRRRKRRALCVCVFRASSSPSFPYFLDSLHLKRSFKLPGFFYCVHCDLTANAFWKKKDFGGWNWTIWDFTVHSRQDTGVDCNHFLLRWFSVYYIVGEVLVVSHPLETRLTHGKTTFWGSWNIPAEKSF